MEKNKGFTLIELLVVIAIIGVLATVILLSLNPGELLARGRDSTRIQDFATIRKAIDASIASSEASIVLPTGNSAGNCRYSDSTCISSTTNRSSRGTGWLPINIASFVSILPIDPRQTNSAIMTNNLGSTVNARYIFGTDGSTYRLATYLESRTNLGKLTEDGGTMPTAYESGTDMAATMQTP
jgi:prepilin-type N-terminal cleavage/methylation domain-containing protein